MTLSTTVPDHDRPTVGDYTSFVVSRYDYKSDWTCRLLSRDVPVTRDMLMMTYIMPGCGDIVAGASLLIVNRLTEAMTV